MKSKGYMNFNRKTEETPQNSWLTSSDSDGYVLSTASRGVCLLIWAAIGSKTTDMPKVTHENPGWILLLLAVQESCLGDLAARRLSCWLSREKGSWNPAPPLLRQKFEGWKTSYPQADNTLFSTDGSGCQWIIKYPKN
jgi:hypothetical protein